MKIQPSLEAVAFCTADEYDLDNITSELFKHQEKYKLITLPDDIENVIHFQTTLSEVNSKEVFVFKEGTVVFWNVPSDQVSSSIIFMLFN